MNPVTPDYPDGSARKDAIYFSVHKFIGGVQTPGVLVVNKSILRNRVPNGAGGGTVFFVDRKNHLYLRDAEMREEGGTPAIVESIRAGLVFKLKESVTARWIMEREQHLVQLAVAAWSKQEELVVLGSLQVPRLSIFSFLIRHPKTGLYLHHNFVCALLNDLYGIQSRGGCACAGPYALDLLGIDEPLAQRYKAILIEDDRLDRDQLRRKEEHSSYEVLRPGFSRLNLPYFASDAEVDFLRAVTTVARKGWKMLPYYQMNPETGEWHHHNQLSFKDRKWLGFVDFTTGAMRIRQPKTAVHATPEAPTDYEQCLQMAEEILDRADGGPNALADQCLSFNDEAASLRWFLLPSEAQDLLRHGVDSSISAKSPPFTPRRYGSSETSPSNGLHHYSTIPPGVTHNHHPTFSPAVPAQADLDLHSETEESEEEINDAQLDESDGFMAGSFNDLYDDDDEVITKPPVKSTISLWKPPTKDILKPTLEALIRHKMISNGDKVLVCVSGGILSLYI